MEAVIGLSTRPVPLDGSFGLLTTHTLADTYTTAVRSAGGIPVLIPTDGAEVEDEFLDRLDGLILTGGGDVDPALYGRAHHGSVHGVDPERDKCEVRLATTARERGIPVLGICRGLQIINVAFGGDLVIDVSSEIAGAINHKTAGRAVLATHPVRLDPESRLAQLVGDEVVVNSSHHQAARRLGDGLRAVARTVDGVIEAIEADDEGWWCWGVQWHPEQRTPDNASAHRPFEALLEAALRHHPAQRRRAARG